MSKEPWLCGRTRALEELFHSYHFFLMRILDVYFLSHFQVYVAVLTIVIMLYIRSPELIHLIIIKLIPFYQHGTAI